MKKCLLPLLSIVMVLSLVLGACGTTPVPTEKPVDTPVPTEKPADTPVPTEAPTDTPEPVAGSPDLTGETITLYHFGDLSGPYAAITAPLIHGAEDAVAAVNEAGGVYGAELEIKFADTAGSIDEAVAAYDRFTGEDDNPLVMITYGSGEVEALAGRFAQDEIVNISAGLSAQGFYVDSGYTFGLGPIYPDQMAYVMEFLKENWDAYRPEGAGDEIKLAYLSWPTAFGQGALTDESRAYLDGLGIEIVAEETYDLAPTADTTTAILNAEAAGANVIWTNTLAFGTSVILNDLNALGLRDQFVVGCDNWGMDLATYAFLADPAYGVGLISPFPYLWWTDTDNPGVQYAQQLFDANERDMAEHNVGYLLLIAGVDMAVDAIKHAIDEGGYEDLTGAAVHDALVDLSPFEPLEGVLRSDYSGGSRSPHVSQIRMIQGGPDAFVVIQDWAEMPDLRPSAAPEDAEGPPDLTGETITLYHFGDLSGPYAAITAPLIQGAEDAVAAINAAGGLYGATLEIEFADTAGSVDEAVAAYDRFTGGDENPLVMITYGSGEVEALAPRFAEDKVVNITAGLSARGFYIDSGYTFGLGPIYPDQMGFVMEFLKDNWNTYKPAGAGDEIKLGYLSWPTAFGQGALTDESRAYLEGLGIEVVAEEVYDVSPTADTTTAILNAQAAGANVIWTNTLAFGPAALLNDLNALGLRDQFVVAGDNWAMDLATYAFLADPAYGVGLIAPFPYLWWTDTDNSGVQYAQELFEANERQAAVHNVGYLLLVAGVDMAVQAIESAIDTGGYENLTGEAVHDALIALSPFGALDGVLRLDYSDDSRSPHTSQLRMIQGGPDAFVVIQDWTDIPDLRPAE
jgi:branched-chain amino acid transport system substrate-binding protein